MYLCQKLTIYILKSNKCLGCFCWVSQKVENSLVSQQSIALYVYFCACISCNKIVMNAEILLLLGASRHIFKSHKASRDTSLILCIEYLGIAYSFDKQNTTFSVKFVTAVLLNYLHINRPVLNFIVPKLATWL